MKSILFTCVCFIIVFLCISYADKKVNEIYGLEPPQTLQNIFDPLKITLTGFFADKQ